MMKYYIFLVSMAFLLVSGCGFEPIYRKDSLSLTGDKKISEKLTEISIKLKHDNRNHEKQELRIALEDALNPYGKNPEENNYILEVDLSVSGTADSILSDGAITRSHIVISSNYTLKNKKHDKLIIAGKQQQLIAYDSQNMSLSILVAKEEKIQDGVVILANKIKKQIINALSNENK